MRIGFVNTFDNIILTGRPASGKSEFIDFLKGVPAKERIKKFHVGEFDELDDFLWVWEMGEADDIREKLGRPRADTVNVGHGYYTKEPELVLTKFMTLKMNREILEKYESRPEFYRDRTLFIEFARGGKGAYRWTLDNFDEKVLRRSAIFFLSNSFEESVRRNEARYRARKKHSILAHKVPDEELHGIYKTHDWLELTGGRAEGCLDVKGVRLPFVTVSNEPEVTDPKLIEERFAPPLVRLWGLYSAVHSDGG